MPHDNAHPQHRPPHGPHGPHGLRGPRGPHGPRGPQRTGSAGIPDGLLVGVLAFLLGATLFTWTATGLAGLFAHGSWPEGVSFGRTPLAIRELATEPHNLRAAWPETPAAELSGYGLFWGIFISQIMVLIVLTIFVLGTVTRARAVRQARRLAQEQTADAGERPGGEGPAEEHHLRERPRQEHAPQERPVAEHLPQEAPLANPTAEQPLSAPGEPAQHPSTTTATPGIVPVVPAPVPAPVPAQGGREARQAANGPQDAATRVLDAPGAVLVASPSPVLWAATKAARSKLGPVHLFDPTHACDTPDRLRWAPHHGCADRAAAAARATALLAPLRSPRPIDATTHTSAETLLRCWLHAAALEGRPFREVHRWALASTPATDPVQTLRTHPKASSGSAGELESVLTGHPQLRADATALIRRSLAPLSQLHVRNACTATRADRIAVESFINETGTLYVVGEDPDVMPILHALTQSVVELGRRVAARSSAGRLDPPLTSIVELNVP